jgi:hypothetical protein
MRTANFEIIGKKGGGDAKPLCTDPMLPITVLSPFSYCNLLNCILNLGTPILEDLDGTGLRFLDPCRD